MQFDKRLGLDRVGIEPSTGEHAQPPRKKKLRIAYLSGPSDAPAVFREWSGEQNAEYFGSNYMKQFLQTSAELDAETYVITNLPGEYSFRHLGQFIFENRPPPSSAKGIRHHLSFFPWFVRLTPKIFQFKPDVIVVTMYEHYWFLWFFFRWFGIPMIPSFHGLLWPKYAVRKSSLRVLWQLNRWLVLRYMKVMIVTSNDIARQLQELLGKRDSSRIEFVRHFPTYSPSQFAHVSPPTSAPRPPFKVFFAGRIETNKGVYDLVEVARRLEANRKGEFHFDICGDGGELNGLRSRIKQLSLDSVVTCHGYCTPDRIVPLLGASHAWVVPTTSEFAAGFEMVCAEAILANRPLITSDVCPALEDVREATVEVRPDDVDGFRDAVLKLCDDPNLYSEKFKACAALQAQFYDLENSLGSKLKEVLIRYIVRPAAVKEKRTFEARQ